MPSIITHSTIDELPAADWNRLVGPDTPFLRHEFLAALERNGCVGEGFGWLPRHLALRDAAGNLVAAAPCYLNAGVRMRARSPFKAASPASGET